MWWGRRGFLGEVKVEGPGFGAGWQLNFRGTISDRMKRSQTADS